MDLLVWRLGADPRLIDRFYRQRVAEPGTEWYQTQAKVKLLGHGEECVAFATRRNLVTLGGSQRQQWRVAEAALRRMLEDIEAWNLTKVRETDRDLLVPGHAGRRALRGQDHPDDPGGPGR